MSMPSLSRDQQERLCYFAHHVTDYDTSREEHALEQLKTAGFTHIFNPNSPESQKGYEQHGMEYFLGIVATCSVLAFQRFPNNEIGAGVAKEITLAVERGLNVYEVTESGIDLADGSKAVETSLSIEETRALIRHFKTNSYMDS